MTFLKCKKNRADHKSAISAMKLPTAELWGTLMSQATEVALTIACPNRSRAAEYND